MPMRKDNVRLWRDCGVKAGSGNESILFKNKKNF